MPASAASFLKEKAMKAAVVRSFDQPPRCEELAGPTPKGREEMLVDVLAAGLHPRVRSQAAGSHYTSTGELPLIPGIDGVGRGADGKLRYFVLDDTQFGSMAETTVVEVDRSVVLPPGTDPIAVAAGLNPAMGSWLALRCRVPFKKRQKVLVLGATGSAGSMAVQVARHLGASQIIAAGRNQEKLAKLTALGATETVALDDSRLGTLARDVDVVLDFVWGETTAEVMAKVITEREDRSRPLTWIEIGSVTGPTAAIPSAALRAARLQIVGSGIGSVPGRDIVDELPSLVKEIVRGTFRIDAKAMPLASVEQAWSEAEHTSRRIVLTPRQ
jgi:NADPH:quinone reductase-like Zn-dependent oxidoreductase